MKQYHDLMQHILDNGVRKDDRTGTGTLSVFGHQMRFDLQEGFPLVTTKKVHLKSVIHELLWMIKGDTNIKYLNDNGVTIWDEWAGLRGELGPVYGHSWRSWGRKPNAIKQPIPQLRKGLEPNYLGVANGAGKENTLLGKTWEGMIARCYDPANSSYYLYGGKGVFVNNDWLEFKVFGRDAVNLPGWADKVASDVTRFVIDKDVIGNGFEYGPKTSCWVTDKVNSLAKSRTIYTVERGGILYSFRNPSTFCAEQGIPNNNISDLWTGRKNAKTRHGFSFVSAVDTDPGIDQLREVIESIRNNPDSRRHLVSSWDVPQINSMALPPCHILFQFYVVNGKLSCQLYQRSADVFLGVPFNIASYSLLTMMIAHVVGLMPGEFIWTGGDCHLYLNHLEQAKEQLGRSPKRLPEMLLNCQHDNIDDFVYDDFELIGYDPWPAIKAPVAV